MQNEKTYNGWTNYATLRVKREIIDGLDPDYFRSEIRAGNAANLSKRLKTLAKNVISEFDAKEGLAVDYALAFLADVNFDEIAQHLIDSARTEVA